MKAEVEELREALRDRKRERYVRRGDCLALAVQLCARKPVTASVVLQVADDFERWLMKPFDEQDDAD